MIALRSDQIDYLEAGSLAAGSGPLVVLVHSSVAGARQWRKLIESLSDSFTLRAINLFGYGATVPWPEDEPQTLDDQARLVEAIIPADAGAVCLVGHSFGGTVAMKAALRMGARVAKLVLLEPNPFTLLRDHGRDEAFQDVCALREVIKQNGERGDWMTAAERFADYWGGAGTWSATPDDRRAAFAEALQPNFHEWDAVMNDGTALETWVAFLPAETLVVYDPATVRPIREIVELLREGTPWRFQTLAEGGHMAPLSRPDLVNPVVQGFLEA